MFLLFFLCVFVLFQVLEEVGREGRAVKNNQTSSSASKLKQTRTHTRTDLLDSHLHTLPHHPPPLSLSAFLNLSICVFPSSPSSPRNSILYLLVMESSSAVLCQTQKNTLNCWIKKMCIWININRIYLS